MYSSITRDDEPKGRMISEYESCILRGTSGSGDPISPFGSLGDFRAALRRASDHKTGILNGTILTEQQGMEMIQRNLLKGV